MSENSQSAKLTCQAAPPPGARWPAPSRALILEALAGHQDKPLDARRAINLSMSLAGNTDQSLPRPGIDTVTEHAVRTFVHRIAARYPVQEAILFGSRARGDHGPDSDADLAVVLSGTRGDRVMVAREWAALAFGVMLETGVLVEALPLWQSEVDQPARFSNPALLQNIQREGLRL